MPRRRAALHFVATAMFVVVGCASNETTPESTAAPTTTVAASDGGLTALDFRVMAQEQIGRSINGVDYECELPTSTAPGTEFNCAGELNGNELHVLAVINADGTVTLSIVD